MKVATVVLAAGYGTRMHSDIPKMAHPVMGRPMIDWAVRTAEAVSDLSPTVVVGHRKELIQSILGERVQYAEQAEMLGTGHAVMQATDFLRGTADIVLVTYGDMPLLRSSTVEQLIVRFREAWQQGDEARPAIVMLTVKRDDAQGFGRVVRDNDGAIQAIVEEVDCTPEQKKITELNPGIYCFEAEWLWNNLSAIEVSPKGEYYLTDMIAIAVEQGRTVESFSAPLLDVDGINTRVHLAQATAVMRQRILETHLLNGVTIIDPQATYIEDGVSIGQDTVLWPGTILRGQTVIGSHAIVGPNTEIVNSTIGNGCRATYSVIEDARMDDHSEIGPFGHLRKGAHLGEGVHMGNFGEVKNSYLAPGTKMGHFSYLGDTTVGENVNIGAGTITCNFDGQKKNATNIADNVFIGSNTLLIAPVTVGANARTGAGSVVTKDVAPDALVYGVPARLAKSSDEPIK